MPWGITLGKKTRPVPFGAILLAVMALVFVSVDIADVWRGLTTSAVRRHYRGWPSLESNRFHVRFTEKDREWAEWVAAEAERAASLVKEILPYTPPAAKPWLVIAPDQASIRQAFGWGEGTGALGVYLLETIIILSPQAYEGVDDAERRLFFARQGPLVHEVTHYVLDVRTGGNYPRWFSEGLAQLLEYQLLGFEWLEADSSLGQRLYKQDELDYSFAELPRQALAYRQALSMVTYLESLRGLDGLNLLLDKLAKDRPFYLAVEAVYGQDRSALVESWRSWFPAEGRWFLPVAGIEAG